MTGRVCAAVLCLLLWACARPEPIHELMFHFDGTRCATAMAVGDVSRHALPLVRREAQCEIVDAASVRCETDADADGRSRERWRFSACGKRVELLARFSAQRAPGSNMTNVYQSINVDRSFQPRKPKPNDLVLDFGKGDAIRLQGMGDNFDCDDPDFAGVRTVPTYTLQFADGTETRLCTLPR